MQYLVLRCWKRDWWRKHLIDGSSFSYGEKDGLPLSVEEDGFIPTDSVLREKFGHSFTGGYVAHASIGQGYPSTPIQVAQMMAGVGNGFFVPK